MRLIEPTAADGDLAHEFDVKTSDGLKAAEDKFKEIFGRGFMPVKMGKDGEPGEKLHKFDKEAEEVFFRPQLQGG